MEVIIGLFILFVAGKLVHHSSKINQHNEVLTELVKDFNRASKSIDSLEASLERLSDRYDSNFKEIHQLNEEIDDIKLYLDDVKSNLNSKLFIYDDEFNQKTDKQKIETIAKIIINEDN